MLSLASQGPGGGGDGWKLSIILLICALERLSQAASGSTLIDSFSGGRVTIRNGSLV